MITHGGRKVVVEIDADAEGAADDAAYWLGHAATIFERIGSGIAAGFMDGDNGFLISLGNVCARAFRSVADDEGERLQRVAMAIRDECRRAVQHAEGQKAMLQEQADEAVAKGQYDQAAYLRGIATGDIDPMQPDSLPRGRKRGMMKEAGA